MTTLTKPQRNAWREFTSTKAYEDGIAYVKDHLPRLSASAPPTADTILFYAGKSEGFLLALDILRLLSDTPESDLKSPDQPGLESNLK